MNRHSIHCLLLALALLCQAEKAFACEVILPCSAIETIHVSIGRQHLAGGETKVIYVADVDVLPQVGNLKAVYAECSKEDIVIHAGGSVLKLPKAAISPAGNWFGIDASTPEEALDAAMNICPDKVKSYLP